MGLDLSARQFPVNTMSNAVHSDSKGICSSMETLHWPEVFVTSLHYKRNNVKDYVAIYENHH